MHNLTDYVRSTFLYTGDGQFVDWKGGKYSLNSRLKLLELAPFGTNPFSSNPYANLPKDLTIYKSCYPIILDKKDSSAKCQKNSVGMIIRIYKLTTNELYSRFKNLEYDKVPVPVPAPVPSPVTITITSAKPENNPENYDVWRDEKYYEFVRNNIDKSYISPNFIQSYCYFLWSTAELNYGKNGKLDPTDKDKVLISESKLHMILLCEAPTMNLLTWTTNLSTKDKNTVSQIYSGYKPVAIWETVIFQMLSVFYVMDKLKFTFTEMSVKDNFYIKDVNVYGDTSTQFWIYRINGIDYYIPCKGDLLMLDHNYHDLTSTDKAAKKIVGEMFGDPVDNISNKIKENMIKCINSDQFNSTDTNVTSPPQDIINLLNNINTKLNTKTSTPIYSGAPIYSGTPIKDNYIEEIIQTYFAKFLHNRIGTMIRDNEKPYIKKLDIRPFTKGELVIYESKYETYEIVLYLENSDEYTCKCITREKRKVAGSGSGETYISTTVNLNKDMIYHYAESDIIRQDVLPGQPTFSLDGAIETYSM